MLDIQTVDAEIHDGGNDPAAHGHYLVAHHLVGIKQIVAEIVAVEVERLEGGHQHRQHAQVAVVGNGDLHIDQRQDLSQGRP